MRQTKQNEMDLTVLHVGFSIYARAASMPEQQKTPKGEHSCPPSVDLTQMI